MITKDKYVVRFDLDDAGNIVRNDVLNVTINELKDDRDTLILFASSLFSKWGNNDGDAVSHWFWNHFSEDYEKIHGKTKITHPMLISLVEDFLIPMMHEAGYDFTHHIIDTSHNPIRVKEYNGEPWESHTTSSPDDVEEVAVLLGSGIVLSVIEKMKAKVE